MVIFVVCRDPFATSWRQVGKLGVSLKLVVILTHFGLNHFGPTWANFKYILGPTTPIGGDEVTIVMLVPVL